MIHSDGVRRKLIYSLIDSMADSIEIFKTQTGENMLKDKSFSSSDILQTGKNVEQWSKDKKYDELWAQHGTEMKLFDEQLKKANESKTAEDILVEARKKNLARESTKPAVMSEVKTIAGFLNMKQASIESVLVAALQKIGLIDDAYLKQIASELSVNLDNLKGVVGVCKECTSEFNINTVKAVGQVQFFAKEQYLKDVKAVHGGKKYGIDRSAGRATFMTIRTILEHYFDILENEKTVEKKDTKKDDKTEKKDENKNLKPDEKKKLEEENKKKLEEENKKKLEEENKKKLEEENKKKLEEENKKKLEEENKKKKEEEEKKKKEEEEKNKPNEVAI